MNLKSEIWSTCPSAILVKQSWHLGRFGQQQGSQLDRSVGKEPHPLLAIESPDGMVCAALHVLYSEGLRDRIIPLV